MTFLEFWFSGFIITVILMAIEDSDFEEVRDANLPIPSTLLALAAFLVILIGWPFFIVFVILDILFKD